MKTSEYLYGVSAKAFKNQPYHAALKVKERASTQLARLLRLQEQESVAPYDSEECIKLRKRITAVTNAVIFNKHMLEEMK